MKKKTKGNEWPPSILAMSPAEVRAFMESSAASGQTRLDEETQRIARVAALEICSLFNVIVPDGRSFANTPMQTIAIIIAEQIKYKGHARDESRRTRS